MCFVDKLVVDVGLRHSMLIDPLWRCSLCFGKKLEETFLDPIISLISCSVSSIVFVSFKPCNTSIKQFFLASWVVESLSLVLIVVGMISLRKVALNLTILSACVGVGATNHAHVSMVFFWTPVISSSCPLLKLSSRTSL